MDNSMATRPYSTLKGDAYRAYEELPFEVRRALQESLVDWCPLRAREWHQHLLRQHRLRPAQAASFMVEGIRRHDQAEVASFARTWPAGSEAYPHLAAGATLQRYAGPEGIPEAKPLRLAPPETERETKRERKAGKKPKPTPKRRNGRRRR
ncbi:hypothetical protein [Roseomonas sp. USHLN139]|uniref:hypothetical protein n=1 Tax=Roseomonas sp. USHLN139 TaxID=3081298 RepID=UPI003B016187